MYSFSVFKRERPLRECSAIAIMAFVPEGAF
jgi:hypothetical protein